MGRGYRFLRCRDGCIVGGGPRVQGRGWGMSGQRFGVLIPTRGRGHVTEGEGEGEGKGNKDFEG